MVHRRWQNRSPTWEIILHHKSFSRLLMPACLGIYVFFRLQQHIFFKFRLCELEKKTTTYWFLVMCRLVSSKLWQKVKLILVIYCRPSLMFGITSIENWIIFWCPGIVVDAAVSHWNIWLWSWHVFSPVYLHSNWAINVCDAAISIVAVPKPQPQPKPLLLLRLRLRLRRLWQCYYYCMYLWCRVQRRSSASNRPAPGAGRPKPRPQPKPKEKLPECRCLYTYDARDTDELSFSEGDVIGIVLEGL